MMTASLAQHLHLRSRLVFATKSKTWKELRAMRSLMPGPAVPVCVGGPGLPISALRESATDATCRT